jgi:hypothetical protein
MAALMKICYKETTGHNDNSTIADSSDTILNACLYTIGIRNIDQQNQIKEYIRNLTQ